jgi:hypothetical protein
MSTTDPVPAVGAVRHREPAENRRPGHEGSRLPLPEELRLLAVGRTGLVPLILVASIGLLAVSVGLAISRSNPGSNWAELLFWVGLVVLVAPFASWLAGVKPTRTERCCALIVLGLLLYLVKIVHDPYGFVYADEWVHTYNAQEIVRTGALYHANPIIAVTARYPGLEAVTAAVVSTTGLSVFASGAIVLGAARIALVLALFMIFERLTGSARVASIAGVVYLTNPNFLFWSAQFSYESLALPLVTLAAAATIAAVRSEEPAPGGERRRWTERSSWTVIACLAAVAAAATHHLSAWALCVFLIVTCIVCWARPRTRSQAPWLVTGVAVAATSLWFVLVAPGTGTYLFPVIGHAIRQTYDTLIGHSSGRGLFQAAGGSHTQVAPAWQRAFAVASVALILVGLPFGLRNVWRKYRLNPYVVSIAIAALVYVAILPMRLVPAAWETSNRSSEFLFVGVAMVLGLAGLARWSSRRFALGAAACAAVLLIGGIVAGWPPRVLLSLPYQAQVAGAVISSQPSATAAWAKNVLGPGRRFIAPESVARELMVHGNQVAYTTSASFDARSVLYAPDVTAGIVQTLGDHSVKYVAVDRRVSGDDSMAGYFFPRAGDRGFIDPPQTRKYDDFPGVDRLLDVGDIVVYDVNRLWNVTG